MSPDVIQFFGVMMTLMITGLAGYAGVTVINAIRNRVGGRPAEVEPGELEQIRAELAQVDQLRARVEELEERLDFTERLLVQHQEPPRLGEGA